MERSFKVALQLTCLSSISTAMLRSYATQLYSVCFIGSPQNSASVIHNLHNIWPDAARLARILQLSECGEVPLQPLLSCVIVPLSGFNHDPARLQGNDQTTLRAH